MGLGKKDLIAHQLMEIDVMGVIGPYCQAACCSNMENRCCTLRYGKPVVLVNKFFI